MTEQQEMSLLMHLESRAVDHGGLLDMKKISEEEFDQMTRWLTAGFIRFGRVQFADVKATRSSSLSHWVELSDEAWTMAHYERRQKAQRLAEKRTWKKTEES